MSQLPNAVTSAKNKKTHYECYCVVGYNVILRPLPKRLKITDVIVPLFSHLTHGVWYVFFSCLCPCMPPSLSCMALRSCPTTAQTYTLLHVNTL